MSYSDNIGPYFLLAIGLGALALASKKKPSVKLADRSGEICDPSQDQPHGYVCVTDGENFILARNARHFIGYSPYINREQVDSVLDQLGFPDGNLKAFQVHMTHTSKYTLREDGFPDAETMVALRFAQDQHSSGKWKGPSDA